MPSFHNLINYKLNMTKKCQNVFHFDHGYNIIIKIMKKRTYINTHIYIYFKNTGVPVG